jgi:hypothetical protein
MVSWQEITHVEYAVYMYALFTNHFLQYWPRDRRNACDNLWDISMPRLFSFERGRLFGQLQAGVNQKVVATTFQYHNQTLSGYEDCKRQRTRYVQILQAWRDLCIH